MSYWWVANERDERPLGRGGVGVAGAGQLLVGSVNAAVAVGSVSAVLIQGWEANGSPSRQPPRLPGERGVTGTDAAVVVAADDAGGVGDGADGDRDADEVDYC